MNSFEVMKRMKMPVICYKNILVSKELERIKAKTIYIYLCDDLAIAYDDYFLIKDFLSTLGESLKEYIYNIL